MPLRKPPTNPPDRPPPTEPNPRRRPFCRAGHGDDHCCWLGEGGVCPYVRDDGVDAPGRRWVCTLMEELGDWDLVHADPRYVRDVRVWWDRPPSEGTDCGDFPAAVDGTCPVCGIEPRAVTRG